MYVYIFIVSKRFKDILKRVRSKIAFEKYDEKIQVQKSYVVTVQCDTMLPATNSDTLNEMFGPFFYFLHSPKLGL